MDGKIYTVDDLIARVNELGILPFWDDGYSAWQMCGTDFNTFWSVRERAVNTLKLAYARFVNKKATFVSLEVLPYLCALRRDGYDFDSLQDEGRVPNRESIIMNNVGETPVPSYALGKALSIKGYDGALASLQNKTYLCLTFGKSYMGTALLNRPETLFGYDFVRSAYALNAQQCAQKIRALAKGLERFPQATAEKILSPAV